MKWDILSAISELIAAVGVIISLLYLARQIRSGIEQDRQVVTQSLIAKGTAFLTQIAHNSQFRRYLVQRIIRNGEPHK